MLRKKIKNLLLIGFLIYYFVPKNHLALISLFISAVEKIQFYILSVQISLCVWMSLVGTSGISS